jgi:hypothetical protein
MKMTEEQKMHFQGTGFEESEIVRGNREGIQRMITGDSPG